MDIAKNIVNPHQQHPVEPPHTACESMPDLTRLRYFYGQLLAHHDLETEQNYFHEKLKLHNRCLHGYGTVCGLKVVSVKEEPDCDPKDEHRPQHKPARVEIECGLAVDCEGNELIVRRPLPVDLWDELNDAERDQISRHQEGNSEIATTLYLSLCYCVQPIDPVRPVLPDACGAVSECIYSKLRDSVRVIVTTEKPHDHHCRNACCAKCENKCLLLAAIDLVKSRVARIRNDVRRWITQYEPVTITGINWYHGAAYTVAESRALLRHEGLAIHFSRRVLTETLTDGVVDAWVMEGGSGRSGNIYNMQMRLILPVDGGTVLPTTDVLKFKRTSGETLQDGDRVLITLRSEFVLDECCRAVDGNHIGGRVPYVGSVGPRHRLRNNHEIEQQRCLKPPQRYGPWVSGNGSPGGSFESWFYIKDPDTVDSADDADATAQY